MSNSPIQLWENLYADTELIPVDRYSDERRAFVSKVSDCSTSYYLSALESIEAALALIAIGQISQSYILFFQSLEVTLKGLLDEYKADGLRVWMAKNPKLAAKLANKSSGELFTNIDEMTLLAAFRECDTTIDFPTELKGRVNHLNSIRNSIVHSGGDPTKSRHYLNLIVNVILPLLDHFYQATKSACLSDFIGGGISRELVVIAKYLKLSASENWINCLALFHRVYFNRWSHSQAAMVVNNPNFGDGGDDIVERAEIYERRMKHDLIWLDILDFKQEVKEERRKSNCRICGSECFASSRWMELPNRLQLEFDVQEVRCPNCRLEITDPLLALLHYGSISQELLGQRAWKELLSSMDRYKAQA